MWSISDFSLQSVNLNLIKCILWVSRCGHLSCRSRHFDCLLLVLIRSTGCTSPSKSRCLAVIGAFRSWSFRCEVVSREVRWRTALLLCFLIVGINASGISIPLSLLMLSGLVKPYVDSSLTLRMYQCGSRKKGDKTLESDSGLANRMMLTRAEIADFLDFVLRSIYFQDNGSIYERQEGAAMGSPVSVVIAAL